MVFIEHRTGSVFEVIGSEDCDAVSGEFLGECGASVVIFEGRDAGSDFSSISIQL